MTTMITHTHINSYLRHLAQDLRRSERTLAGYSTELGLLLDRGVALEPLALANFVSTRVDGVPLAATTRNRRLSIVRGFIRHLRELGVLTGDDPLAKVRRARVPKQVRSALTAKDVEALARVLLDEQPSWRRTRDGTILLLFFYTGLRLSELVSLNLDQVDLRARVLRRATRKGGDITDVVLHPTVVEQLRLWLGVRPAGPDEPALFPRGNTGRLGGRGIEKRLKQLGAKAGLGNRLHPHLLRHAHGTGLLRAGAATAIIQQSMNHHSLATTEVYLHGDEVMLREAIERLPRLPVVAGPPPERR